MIDFEKKSFYGVEDLREIGVNAVWPQLTAYDMEELAARLLFRLDAQDAALKKLMKCSAAALQTLL